MLNRSNFWQGEGNLSRDPEVHTTPNRAEVVHFTIAVTGAGSGSGEKDAAGFFDCKIWLTENDYTVPAEVANAREGFKSGNWKKGTKLHVMGRLIQERWEKNGESRSRIIVQADKVQALYVRPVDGANGAPATTSEVDYSAAPKQTSVAAPASF
jgi:single-stranded DNA-binding protein